MISDFILGLTNRIVIGRLGAVAGLIVTTLSSLNGAAVPAYQVKMSDGDNAFMVTNKGAVGVGTGSLASIFGSTGNCLKSGGNSGALLSWSSCGGGDVISGTGAANKLAYFTGLRTMSGAGFLTIDHSTRQMAIGTSTMARTFHVYGTTNAGIRTSINNGATHWALYNNGTAAEEWQWYMEGGDLRLYDTTDRVTFEDGGNVGIGTTNPASKLHLSDATPPTFSMSDTAVAHGITGFAPTDAFFHVNETANDDGGAEVWGFGASAGRIPMTILGVFGVTDPTDTVAAIQLFAGRKSGTSIADLGALETALQVSGGSSGTDYLTILGGGNVGIGTATPAVTLDVLPNAINGVALRLSDRSTDATAKYPKIVGRHYTNSEENFLMLAGYSDGSDTDLYFGGVSSSENAATRLRFYTAATTTTLSGTERMRIDSAGNVGIGTTDPTQILQTVFSDTATSGLDAVSTHIAFKNSNTTNNNWVVLGLQGNDVSSTQFRMAGIGAQITSHASGTPSADLAFDTLNSGTNGEKMRIKAGGNVGIGKTAPATKLDVVGTISGSALHVNGNITLGVTATPKITTAGDDLTLEATGDSFGTVRLALQNRNGSAGALFENVGLDLVDFGFMPNSGVQSNLRLEHRVANIWHAGNTLGEFQFFNGSNFYFVTGPSGTLIQSGNLGVGTRAPETKLEVIGTASGTTLYASKNLTVQGTGSLAIVQTNDKQVTVNATLENGLLAWFGMDTLSGSNVNNLAVTANHSNSGALIGGTTMVTGKFGRGLQFDGTDDYVNVGSESMFDLTGYITVSAWIKPNAGARKIVSKSDGGTTGFDFDINGFVTGNIDFCAFTAASNYLCRGGGPITNGAWQHVVGVFDKDLSGNSRVKVYINGVDKTSTTNAVGTLTTMALNDYPVTIGTRSGVTPPYYNGSMDDVRIYSRALSAREVADLYRWGGMGNGGTMSGTIIIEGGASPLLNVRGTISGAALTVMGGAGNSYFLNGNVGIGLTNPTTKLQLFNASGNSYVSIGDLGSGYGGVGFSSTLTAANYSIANDGGNGTIINSATGQPINFRINNGEVARISSAGNLGIGDIAPSTKLEVVGTISGSTLVAGLGSASAPAISFNGDSDTGITASGANGLSIVTGGTRQVFVNSSGNVGIGTSAVQHALTVEKNSATVPAVVSLRNLTNFTAVDTAAYYRLDAVFSSSQKVGYIGLDRFFDSDGTLILSTDSAGGITFSANNTSAQMKFSAAGNLGIGTTSPDVRLDVLSADNTQATNIFRVLSNNETAGIALGFRNIKQTGTNTGLDIDANGAGHLALQTNATGNVGIGKLTPVTKLEVVGTISGSIIRANKPEIGNALIVNGSGSFTGQVSVPNMGTEVITSNAVCIEGGVLHQNAAATCTVSSKRFKHDIEPLTDGALEIVKRMRPVSFRDNNDNELNVGFIAEEMEKVEPRLVFYEQDGVTPRGVKYENFTAILTKAIQELHAENKELKERVTKLESRLSSP